MGVRRSVTCEFLQGSPSFFSSLLALPYPSAETPPRAPGAPLEFYPVDMVLWDRVDARVVLGISTRGSIRASLDETGTQKRGSDFFFVPLSFAHGRPGEISSWEGRQPPLSCTRHVRSHQHSRVVSRATGVSAVTPAGQTSVTVDTVPK